MKKISRKHFLRGTGGAAMALPFLDIMATEKHNVPRRILPFFKI